MNDLARMPKNLSAIKFGKAGFRVLPVPPNEKGPKLPEWQLKATTDRAQIEKWWEENPDYNIGLLADGYLVVDIDVTNGGLENWHALTELLEPPPTFTVKTPRGGYHLRYRLPDGVQVGNPRDHPARGIDIRGQAGQSLAPGSDIDGKPYRILTEPENGIVPLLPKKKGELPAAVYAPEWLIRMCGKPVGKKAELAGIRLNEETENTVDAAIDYLQNRAPIAIQGEGGDGTTYEVAAELGDIGVDLDTAHHLMLEEWNERCDPPWDPDDLRVKVESGYRNRQNAIGIKNPDLGDKVFEGIDFGPGEEASMKKAPAEVKRHRWEFIDPHESRAIALKGRNPLVEGVFYEGEISVTYGRSGSRKSMFTMDMDYHIWMGRKWYGRAVTQGPTLWVGAEGGLGVHLRNETMWAFHKPEGPPFFGMLQASMNLLRSKEDFSALVGAMQRKQDHWKRPVAKITIDTLTAVSAGGDLNGSDMTAMLERVWTIREKIGKQVHINVIHHPGKDQTKGMRGSQTMYDGVDATIFVKKETKRSGTAYLGKQRDGEDDCELLRFVAKDIQLEPDEKGRPRSGQVIVARVAEGMLEVEETIQEQRPPTIKEQQPWIDMGISESTFWRRKREGKL